MSVNIFDKQKGDIVQIAGNAFNNNIDTVARNAIAAHEGDTVIHVSAAEKASWNGKAELTDIPTMLPANGGNADTVGGKYPFDFVNYLGEITDVDNILNNPRYEECSYEGIISSVIANSIGLPAIEWNIKCFRASEGSGCQIAFPVYDYSGESPKYRLAVKHSLSGGAYAIAWGKWKNVSDGGNADTLNELRADEIAINPNLLDNSNFKINQRGQTEYTASGYTIDRWQISASAKLTPHEGYITFENTVDKVAQPLFQICENPTALSGKTVVLSFDYDLKTEGAWISVQAVTNGSWNPSTPVQLTDTGRSIKSTVINLPDNLTDLRVALVIHGTDAAPLAAADIYGAKLEVGKIATPIIPADPTTELLKCQRYYQIHSSGGIVAVDMRPSMATITDIKQRSDGNYEYIAKL